MADKPLPWGLKTDGLTPGSAKNIPKSKLKAFNIGTMNIKKGMTKKEQDDAKRRNDDELLEDVYKDFVTSFQETGKNLNKAWVKGGIAGEKSKDGPRKKELWKPGKSEYGPDTVQAKDGPRKKELWKPGKSEYGSDTVQANDSKPKKKGLWKPGDDDDMFKDEEKVSKALQLYKPPSKMAELVESFKSFKDNLPDKEEEIKPALPKKKVENKRKSNLELFKEELKVIQEERQERRKFKRNVGVDRPSGGAAGEMEDRMEEPLEEEEDLGRRKSRFEPVEPPPLATGNSMGLGPMDEYKGSVTYSDDNSTTNLYLGNLNPQMTEVQLCELFGRYGPLASVKVMWPRTDEERARGRNCGFVAYMNRKDGERALAALQGKDIMQFEMKLGWGKCVPIPPHPVYVPPKLAELTLPPPPSGLPFNAQPKRERGGAASRRERERRDRNDGRGSYGSVPPPGQEDSHEGREAGTGTPRDVMKDFEKTLANAEVKVVIPTERPLLMLIHRMIEFVVREGPMFEAMIMNREMNNPQFRFLFENQSPAHVYYRWKLFTVLQGDNPYSWRLEPFKMFKGGSIWICPRMNPYTEGMPEELIEGDVPKLRPRDRTPSPPPNKRGQLSESQRDRLEDMLRELTPEKSRIGDAMVWCLEHAESAEEVVECLAESLSILQTPLPKKVARMYLVSDILHNCSAKIPHASYYRKFFEGKLPEIFKDVHEYYEKIEGRLKAEQFKQRVMGCFRAWEDWQVYPNEFLIKMQNIFLGLVTAKALEEEVPPGTPPSDVDGEVLEDLDGAPLDGAAIKTIKDDLDGAPLGDPELDGLPIGLAPDVDGMPSTGDSAPETPSEEKKPLFIKSKWESVDESTLEQQAVTTSKWDMFDQYGGDSDEEDEDGDGNNLTKNNGDVDLDGAPMEDLDGAPLDESAMSTPTSARHDRGRSAEKRSREGSPDPVKQQMRDEERRAKLREIELKVVKYQDEVEAGKRSRKLDLTLTEQVEHYRRKLLNKEEEKERDKLKEKERVKEREKVKEWERAREKEKKREREDRNPERSGSRGRASERAERDRGREPRSERSREVVRSGDREREREVRVEKRDRSERRRNRSPDFVEDTEPRGSLSMLQRYGGSVSRSPSPLSESFSRSSRKNQSPPSAYGTSYRESSDSPTPRKRKKSRSRSPGGKKRRSRTPKKNSRSATPKKSKRSRSRSPTAKHKHKKHKRKD